jgi:YkoP-like protein
VSPFRVHTHVMRKGRTGGPLRTLSELFWALPRLSRAGNGRALGVLSIWIAWNRVLEWIWRPQALRPGGILRYRLAHHWGRPLTLKDGTDIAFGNRVVELHFDNGVLYQMAGAANWHPWETFERAAADLEALAHLVVSGQLGDVRALHGVTLFASPGRRLGFELHPVPHTWTWSVQRFYMISLLPIYHRDGWREFDHMRRNRWPAELWMSVNDLLTRSPLSRVGA